MLIWYREMKCLLSSTNVSRGFEIYDHLKIFINFLKKFFNSSTLRQSRDSILLWLGLIKQWFWIYESFTIFQILNWTSKFSLFFSFLIQCFFLYGHLSLLFMAFAFSCPMLSIHFFHFILFGFIMQMILHITI